MEKQKDHFLALTDYPVIPIGTMSKANEAGESAPPSYHQSLLPQVAVSQPPGVVYQYVAPTQVSPEEAPDHLVMAILATVCCCLPLGIVAIVKASGLHRNRFPLFPCFHVSFPFTFFLSSFLYCVFRGAVASL